MKRQVIDCRETVERVDRSPDNLFIGEERAAFDIVLRKSAHIGRADSSSMSECCEIPDAEVV